EVWRSSVGLMERKFGRLEDWKEGRKWERGKKRRIMGRRVSSGGGRKWGVLVGGVRWVGWFGGWMG
ncbi:hypothetical protein, partial [Corynebacterium glyciniphilum]|uniref:hypothetical protein n=1 Tax=Corynebacterium glyciniphilum TaxID=1404244 RepID=UPI001C92EBA4